MERIVLKSFQVPTKLRHKGRYLNLMGRKRQDNGGKCLVRIFTICNPQQIYSAHQIKENEKGRACGTVGER